MSRIVQYSFYLLLPLLLSACGSNPTQTQPSPQPWASSNQSSLVQQLHQQHQDWQGTPYLYGGTSRRGVDCSGFVQLTYRDRLGVTLPRTTTYQSKVGKQVSLKTLQAGDLVFFRTGKKVLHVGVYIEGGQFLHASTSKGVMISHMEDYYWRDKFLYARRVSI